ncbi:hypothetical protein HJFPF1_04600 [Paramyrothecium foliicola]|nr:hypothetical protein HJFPF1_04600 [Paramyrothecium foliicola]
MIHDSITKRQLIPASVIPLRKRCCWSLPARRDESHRHHGPSSRLTDRFAANHRLFVAPVESDLPSKSASKHGVTSPPRSSIRRSGWRDTRVANARRGGLRLYGNVHPGLAGVHEAQALSDLGDHSASPRRNVRLYASTHYDLPYLAGGGSSATLADEALIANNTVIDVDTGEPITSAPIHQTRAEVSQSGERRRERLQEMLHAGLRSLNTVQPDDDRTQEYLGWFAREPEPRSPGGSVPPSDNPRATASARDSPAEDREQPRTGASARRAWRQQSRLARNHLARRGLSSRRGVDGLGDRDRSLSPEVWDTLLSTLTPDPQPPSASSSFASAAASQTAAPSSNTTPPTVGADPQADGPCESGCEHSDAEDDDYESGPPFPMSPPPLVGDATVREYNLDGPAEGPFARPTRREGRGSSVRRSAVPDGPIPSSRQGSTDDTTGRVGGAVPLSRLLHPPPRDGWVGRLSVGASDEEHGEDSGRRVREGSASNNASGGDEDLSGMQRIIRSLSWRQDIPEEWWAEAGLRRTLPPDTELS